MADQWCTSAFKSVSWLGTGDRDGHRATGHISNPATYARLAITAAFLGWPSQSVGTCGLRSGASFWAALPQHPLRLEKHIVPQAYCAMRHLPDRASPSVVPTCHANGGPVVSAYPCRGFIQVLIRSTDDPWRFFVVSVMIRSSGASGTQCSTGSASGGSHNPYLRLSLHVPGTLTGTCLPVHLHLHRFSTMLAPCSSYSFFEIHI